MCILGHEPDGSGGCKPCDVGYYRDELNATTCLPCNTTVVGTSTVGIGADNVNLCGKHLALILFIGSKKQFPKCNVIIIFVTVCDAGYGIGIQPDGAVWSECQACQQGTFKSRVGDVGCAPCLYGQGTAGTGSVSESQCCKFFCFGF